MKLSKALKEKNKLIKQINKNQRLLNQHNSVIKGNERAFDSTELLKEIKADTAKLVVLKTAVAKANGPINETILKVGENKSLIAYLKKLDTKDGINAERYGREVLTYEAQLKEKDVINEITTLENEIEGLQEKIDLFNHSTEVEL